MTIERSKEQARFEREEIREHDREKDKHEHDRTEDLIHQWKEAAKFYRNFDY